MIEVTKVLDKWIEQGAIFSDINMVAREVYWWLPQLMMDEVTPMGLSFKDILYGDSNLWEVMYIEDPTLQLTLVKRDQITWRSRNVQHREYHQMQSLLQEDPRQYILDTSPLFFDM
jgi:hypothetical protein